MPGNGVTIRGAGRLQRRLRRAASRIDPAAGRAAMDAADRVAARASGLAPHEHGDLASSIGVEVDGYSAAVVVGEDYAAHVEFGTRHMPAEPYLRPAMDGERAAAMARFGVAARESLR